MSRSEPHLDRWLVQLAGPPSVPVDVGAVRRRARRVRRVRFVRHLGAALAVVAAALAVSQTMIGGTAAEPSESAGDVDEPATAVTGAVPPAATADTALSATPATPAPRSDLAVGSWGSVPLHPRGVDTAAWARDRAYDDVVAADVPAGDAISAAARRITTW